jgi:hypothetical protein
MANGTSFAEPALLFFKGNKGRELDMSEKKGDRIVETPTESRAGITGQGGRYILAISTIAAALVFVGVYLYFFI